MKRERIMETSMNSSQGPRKIHPRRKPTEQEKLFKCSCGKSYLSNESLYTHRKTKHPNELERQFLAPERGEQNLNELEKDETVRKVRINNDTFNMLTKSAFLNFFKEMKQLADDQKEVLKLFHSEKRGYTQLNMAFFEEGYPKFLNYITQAYRLTENIPDPREVRLLSSVNDSHWQGINLFSSQYKDQQNQSMHLPGIHKIESMDFTDIQSEGNVKMSDSIKCYNQNFNAQDNWRGEENNLQKSLIQKSITNSANPPIIKVEDIPEYYRDFFTIAREMVKPMTEKFALEICYLFDKLIELSAVQLNFKIQDYKDINCSVLKAFIASNPNQFPKISALQQTNRESLLEKFLFNLAHLFQTDTQMPEN